LIYPFVIMIYGLYYVVKQKNQIQEVIVVAAYITGAEVFLRMSDSVILYETGKYGVLFFMFLGFIYQGIKFTSFIYFIVLLLLIPGVFVSLLQFSNDLDLRKSIAFNLLGPTVLLVSTFYTFDRVVTKSQFYKILLALGLPLVAMLVYVILYKAISNELFSISESNFETSGGFGPNQVSTMLGFGMFVFFSLFLFYSKSFFQKIVFVGLSLLFGYRCLLTFSRGGLLAAVIMIIALIAISYFNVNTVNKVRLQLIALGMFLVGLMVFSYTVIVTDGMITNRYTGKNAAGKEKKSKLSGREDIAAAEFQLFLENPIFGIGVGRNKVEKAELLGKEAAAHNEISRLLAEHGSFGLVAFLVMFFTPLIVFLFNKNQLFLIPFFLFWFLTINHAALRIAAPAFIYALSLIKVNWKEDS
ncbi:MAG: O-antigen ligase family protein, partial [Flavobacterium sp.]